MMKTLRSNNFLTGAFVYIFSSALSAVIPFLMLPILTRYLNPEEYGQVAMFQILVSLLSGFIGANVNGAIVREYYTEKNKGEYKSFIGACLIILLISGLVTSAIFIITLSSVESLLQLDKSYIFLALFLSFCMFIIKIRLSQYQIAKKVKKYALVQIPNSALNAGISIIFVVCFSLGTEGRIYGIALAGVVTAIFCYISLTFENIYSFKSMKREYFIDAFLYGMRITPHVIGIFLLASIDRIIINKYLGLESSGVYMAGIQLSLVLSLTFEAVNKSYVPWLFSKLRKNDSKDKALIVKYTYYYILSLLILSVVVYFLSPVISLLVLGDEYRDVASIIGIMCIAQCLNGVYLMFTNYLLYAKKVGVLSLITISAGFLHIALSIILIQEYEMAGVAISLVIATLFRCLITFYQSSKMLDMPWFNLKAC